MCLPCSLPGRCTKAVRIWFAFRHSKRDIEDIISRNDAGRQFRGTKPLLWEMNRLDIPSVHWIVTVDVFFKVCSSACALSFVPSLKLQNGLSTVCLSQLNQIRTKFWDLVTVVVTMPVKDMVSIFRHVCIKYELWALGSIHEEFKTPVNCVC